MKKLGIVLGLLLFCGTACVADEVIPQQNADDNRALVTVQKQPAKDNKQQANRNWFCIVIQVNGKVKDSTDTLD